MRADLVLMARCAHQGHVDDATFLEDHEKAAIFSGNALEFLNLNQADYLPDGREGGSTKRAK